MTWTDGRPTRSDTPQSRDDRDRARQLRVCALVVLLIASPAVASLAVAAPPAPPATYYGSVTVDGESAPANLTVTAVVDGEVADSLRTDANGSYGGPGSFDEKLTVNASDGDTVVFRVAGKPAGNVTYESGDDREVALSVADSGPPTVEAGTDQTVRVGETVQFDGAASDDLGVDNTSWTFGDGTTATGESATHAYSSAGTYTVRLTATDAVGTQAVDTLTVTVKEPTPTPTPTETPTPTPTETPTPTPTPNETPTPAPTETSGGGGGGGGGGNPIPPAAVYDVTDTGPRSAQVAVESALANRSVSMVLPRVAGDNVTASQVGFSLARDDAAFEFTVSVPAERPDSTPELRSADAVGFVRVDPEGITDSKVKRGTFRLDVSRQAVNAAGGSPADVAVYRYHDGEWQPLDTRYTGASYVVRSPGFSVFAVAVQQDDSPTATPTPSPTPTPSSTADGGDDTPAAGTTHSSDEPGLVPVPGFGVLPALLALLSAALLLRRRR